MNTIVESIRLGLAHMCYGVAALFAVSLAVYLMRDRLHALYKQWRDFGRAGQVVSLVFVTGMVLYGGSKNTNDCQNTGMDDPPPPPTNMMIMGYCSLPQMAMMSPVPNQTNSSASFAFFAAETIPQWTARGAWCDWVK